MRNKTQKTSYLAYTWKSRENKVQIPPEDEHKSEQNSDFAVWYHSFNKTVYFNTVIEKLLVSWFSFSCPHRLQWIFYPGSAPPKEELCYPSAWFETPKYTLRQEEI